MANKVNNKHVVLDSESHALLFDYAHENRTSMVKALKALINEKCSKRLSDT